MVRIDGRNRVDASLERDQEHGVTSKNCWYDCICRLFQARVSDVAIRAFLEEDPALQESLTGVSREHKAEFLAMCGKVQTSFLQYKEAQQKLNNVAKKYEESRITILLDQMIALEGARDTARNIYHRERVDALRKENCSLTGEEKGIFGKRFRKELLSAV